MIYEHRAYQAVPGKLPALLKRFETVSLRIFAKHGIRLAGCWTTVIGASNQQFIYLLAWESLGERETKWKSFMADTELLAALAESEKDGPLIASITNQMLSPPAFSPMK